MFTQNQPTSKTRMDLTVLDEKSGYVQDGASSCQHQCHHSSCPGRDSRRRIRRAFHFAVASMLALALIAFFSLDGWGAEALYGPNDGLMKRDNTSSSSFVKNKLYLIVAIVGLFVVLILAIMLSAWCCRGSFENPLCCPCYLCACCGGLACLECLACGLCAEGIDQL